LNKEYIKIESGHYKIVYNFGTIEVWDQFPRAHTKIYEFNCLDDLVDLLRKGEAEWVSAINVEKN